MSRPSTDVPLLPIELRDPEMDGLLAGAGETSGVRSVHFNKGEELFLSLSEPIVVPQMRIHHDVRDTSPDASYRQSIGSVLEQLMHVCPSVLRELSYFFDPRDVLKIHLFRLYKAGGRRYLYLQILDMSFRPRVHEALSRDSNDRIPEYRTSRLFIEGLFLPLEGDSGYRVWELFSETWMGERGRGYFRQGIWIDHDLTKFFSKLFLPVGARTYPFYPFVCRYRTLCEALIDFSPEARRRRLPYLHWALETIAPERQRIERDLKSQSFSEELPIFKSLKAKLDSRWADFYRGLTVKPYLNEQEMKEFLVERSQ